MARPLSATDDEILEAAERVMAAHGPQGFSVSKVAQEIGLSRAAITLRFENPAVLKREVYARATARMENAIADWKLERGPAGLLEIASRIGRMVGGKSQLGLFMMRMSENISDPAAREMELERGRILRDAVARAMPETAVSLKDAANAFMAQITGSLIAWQSSPVEDAEAFLVERIGIWLTMAGLAKSEHVA